MDSSCSVTVQCYSGHTYAQEPRAFTAGGEYHTVARVCRRWREPAGPHFEVLADDGATYLLAYDETADHWRLSAQGHHPRTGDSAPTTTSQTEEDGQR